MKIINIVLFLFISFIFIISMGMIDLHFIACMLLMLVVVVLLVGRYNAKLTEKDHLFVFESFFVKKSFTKEDIVKKTTSIQIVKLQHKTNLKINIGMNSFSVPITTETYFAIKNIILASNCINKDKALKDFTNLKSYG